MDSPLLVTGAGLLDVEGEYRRAISVGLNEAMTMVVRDQYRQAHRISRELVRDEQARELTPWLRRTRLESELRSLADRFPEITAHTLRSSGSTFYVRLDVGPVTIISARASDPDKMIRSANYREEIAIASLQPSLFGDEPPPSPEARLYAILLHGSTRGQPDPSFIVVRFPTRDHQTYWPRRVDLKAEFPHLFVHTETRVETITDTQQLTLRRSPGTGTGDN